MLAINGAKGLAWGVVWAGAILALGAAPVEAEHQSGTPFVPLLYKQHADLTQSMYLERASVQFVVYDCTPGQPLWHEANNATSTWEIDARVDFALRINESQCAGSPTNLQNEIYFTQASFPGPEIGDHRFRTQKNELVAEDLRVSLPGVTSRAKRLQTSTRIVIFNQLMNGFGHVLGLDDAYDDQPTPPCHGSVMLGNCRIQRAMPSKADRAALAHLYEADAEPHSDVRRFDTNDNGRIDDGEFRAAMRQWVEGQLGDDLFLAVLEAWNRNERIAGTSRVRPPSTAQRTSVRLLTLNGRRVAERGCAREPALQRAQHALRARASLPAGTYVAVVRACDTGHRQRQLLVNPP